MGRFDGILICSDVDGTLAAGTQVSQRNLDAIRYFQSEGGLFTLSTGRSAGYEKTFSFRLNAPMITENGARVYDPESQKTLRTVPLEESGALLAWLDRPPLQVEGFRCSLCYPDGRVHLASGAVAEAFASRSGDELLKVVCAGFQDGEEALVFQSLARSTFADLYSVVRSWDTGVEFPTGNAATIAADIPDMPNTAGRSCRCPPRVFSFFMLPAWNGAGVLRPYENAIHWWALSGI